jgi:YegS/Rv2252/BmrU family lipid kinase
MVAAHRAALIVNPKSGAFGRRNHPAEIASVLSAAGIESSISVIKERQSAAILAHHAVRDGYETVVACGGDGTISQVASALVGTGSALGVLPAGTLNHFAKDMHIPLDLMEAAQVIARGKTDLIDMGEVNGRHFVNNSSLGIYPNVVTDRERRRKTGLNKWIAFGLAILQVLRRGAFLDVRIDAKGNCFAAHTPFVFIGNNEYEIRGLNIGTRKSLNVGKLYLYVAAPVTRWGLVRMAATALLGRIDQSGCLQMTCVEEAWIETRRRRVRLSNDGEMLRLHAPLHYVLRPRALKVIVP